MATNLRYATPRRLVLGGGGVTFLAERSTRALAQTRALVRLGLWPPLVPQAVLVDCLSGDVEGDRPVERFLETCALIGEFSPAVLRRAAWLRTAAGRGTAVEALVVALAEPGGAVLHHGRSNLEALALFADEVFVERAV